MQTRPIQDTAILIFAYTPAEDSRIKSIGTTVSLFSTLTQQTLKTVKSTGMPYFHFTEKEQHGANFGERFINAIATVYKKGYANVITVGNDSPQLKPFHLLEAKKQLKLDKTVLGPSLDGGFYLMGLHRSHFDTTLFLQLPWQSPGLLGKFSELLENQGANIFKLPVLGDIDTLSDIFRLSSFIKTIPLSILKILRSFTEKPVQNTVEGADLPFYHFTSLYFNKGSPFILL